MGNSGNFPARKKFPKETFPEEIGGNKPENAVLAKPDGNFIPEVTLVLVGRSPWPKPCSGPLAEVAQGCGQVSAEYLQGQSLWPLRTWVQCLKDFP